MRAGKNDVVFDIEQPTETKSGSGAVTRGWEVFLGGVWGQFTWMNGNEVQGLGSFEGETLFSVTTRPIDGLTNKMRLKSEDGRTFDILTVDDMGSRHKTFLKVKLGRSQGS